MVEAGAIEGLAALYGLHVFPSIPVGSIGLRHGALTAAAAELEVEVLGEAGHGARPVARGGRCVTTLARSGPGACAGLRRRRRRRRRRVSGANAARTWRRRARRGGGRGTRGAARGRERGGLHGPMECYRRSHTICEDSSRAQAAGLARCCHRLASSGRLRRGPRGRPVVLQLLGHDSRAEPALMCSGTLYREDSAKKRRPPKVSKMCPRGDRRNRWELDSH